MIEGSGDDIAVMLTIDNSEDKINVKNLEQWFKDNNYLCPPYKVTSNKQIELRIKNDAKVAKETPEQAKAPKQPGLGHVLNILFIKDIKLSAENNRVLSECTVDILMNQVMIGLNAGFDIDVAKNTRATSLIIDDLENYFKSLPTDLYSRNSRVLGESVLNCDLSELKQHYLMCLFPLIKTPTFKPQWTAFSVKPTITFTDAGNFARQFEVTNTASVALNTKQFKDEVKSAFCNISVYGSKLVVDLDNAMRSKANPKKIKELEAKIKGINRFLGTVLSQTDLNAAGSKAAVQKAYVNFETNDKNRGTGLYSFYAS